MDGFHHTEQDYYELEAALMRSENIVLGRPDQYQYYQNQLSKHIASFLLKPYLLKKEKQLDSKD